MTVAAPEQQTSPVLRRVAVPAAVVTGLAAGTLAVHLRDPHVPGSWGFCPSRLLGLDCPGCGGLRAVHDLTHGDLAGALASNPLVVVTLPLAVLGLLAWLLAAGRGRPVGLRAPTNGWAGYAVLAVLVVFMVLRNLPGLDRLGP